MWAKIDTAKFATKYVIAIKVDLLYNDIEFGATSKSLNYLT